MPVASTVVDVNASLVGTESVRGFWRHGALHCMIGDGSVLGVCIGRMFARAGECNLLVYFSLCLVHF
jgi:hypothetical protein